jgi:hypothetical protein
MSTVPEDYMTDGPWEVAASGASPARPVARPGSGDRFYRTTVTFHRPFNRTTPMGVTKITIEAETRAPSAEAAKNAAVTEALTVQPGQIGNWARIDAEAR